MTKKRRSLFIVLGVVCVCVLSCAFVLTGCGKKHKFSSDDWTYDETGHWHECTKHDDCGEIDGFEAHTPDYDNGVVTTPATCGADGVMTYTCTVCGYDKITETIPATGEHTAPEATDTECFVWNWSSATDGKVTVSVKCAVCGEVIDTLNGTYEASTTTEAGCETKGTETWSGTATYGTATLTGTYTVDIPATGHSYDTTDIAWEWTGDHSACTATVTCTVCGDTLVVDAVVTPSADGTTFTATATIEGIEYTEIYVDVAHEHTYTEVEAKEAKCEQAGNVEYYTCTCGKYFTKNEDGNYTETTLEAVTIAALGHDFVYTNDDWTFSDDYTSATLTGKCSRGDTTNDVAATGITSGVKEATCEEDRSTTYTATVTIDNVVYTGTKTVVDEGSKLGHSYTESSIVEWTWAGDDDMGYTAATAKIYCDVCGKTIEENATVTTPTDAGGDTAVFGTYTATVVLTDGTTYVDHKEAGRVSLVHGEDVTGGVAFMNDPDLEIVYDKTNGYMVVGKASVFTVDQIEVFGAGRAGDAYVLFNIRVDTGEILKRSDGTVLYTNNGSEAYYYGICVSLEACQPLTYTISNSDGVTPDITVTVNFDKVVLPARPDDTTEGYEVEDWVTVGPDDDTLTEGGVEFENTDDFSAVYDEEEDWIVLTGNANVMTKEQAIAYNGGNENGSAKVGDAYIIYAVYVPAGATITDLRSGKTWTNDGTETAEYSVCMGLSNNQGYRSYMIVDTEEGVTVVSVSFSGVVLPTAGVESDVNFAPTDTTFAYGEEDENEYFFENKFTITATTGENGEIILNGVASVMTADAALAFDGGEYAVAGDAYVVYSFAVKVGETVIDLQDGWCWSNTGEKAVDDCLSIVMRLTRTGGYAGYEIIHADGTITVYVISFAGITLPTAGAAEDVFFDPTDTVWAYGEEEGEEYFFQNKNTITATTGENGEIILNGVASTMTAEAALAFDGGEYAKEGDAYIVYAIPVLVGETVIDLQDGWYWSNTGENATDDCLSIVMRLTTNKGLAAYAIVHTNEDGSITVTVYTIVFSGIIIPENTEPEVTIVITDDASDDMNVGDEITLTITVDGNTVESYTVEATTDTDADVITVADNKITIVATGSTNVSISFTYNGTDYTVAYTVNVPVLSSEGTEEPQEGTTAIVEVDFSGSSFSADQTAFVTESTNNPQVAPGSAAVVDKDGNETGFTATGTEANSKTINIDSIEVVRDETYRQALVFNGTIATTKNSLAYELEAGIYTVKISYFNSNAGRYATVYDAEGKDRGELVAEEDKTTGDKTETITREITFRLESAQTIYIGSKNSGLYVTFIGIYKVDSVKDKTVTGVSLDENVLEIETEQEIVLSALVTLDDGKTYKNYTDMTYTWTYSVDGVVTGPTSGDNITIRAGEAEGNVTITVTVNIDGTEYSDSCVVTVVLPEVIEGYTFFTSEKIASDTTYTANSEIESNEYFKITASVDMITASISSSSNSPVATLLDGESYTFTSGIEETVNHSANVATGNIYITAVQDISLRVYVNHSDSAHSSNRAGSTITYSIDNGEVTTLTTTARKSVMAIEVSLTVGQVLTIGGTNTATTNSGSVRLWLYGAEATGADYAGNTDVETEKDSITLSGETGFENNTLTLTTNVTGAATGTVTATYVPANGSTYPDTLTISESTDNTVSATCEKADNGVYTITVTVTGITADATVEFTVSNGEAASVTLTVVVDASTVTGA